MSFFVASIEFGGGNERAIIVDDIFLAVVDQLQIVLLQEIERLLGSFQIIGVLELARKRISAGDGQRGNGYTAAGTIADFIFEVVVGLLDDAARRLVAGLIDAELFHFAGHFAQFRNLLRATGGDGTIEGTTGNFHADKIIRAKHGFVEHVILIANHFRARHARSEVHCF